MVELLNDFPPHVAAYKASGAISKEEYEQVVMTRVSEVAEKYGKIDFLVLLDTGMENYSIGAFLDYLKLSFRHFTRWKRMAIISDQRWLRMIYNGLSPFVPGTIRTYDLRQFDEAKKWVSGG